MWLRLVRGERGVTDLKFRIGETRKKGEDYMAILDDVVAEIEAHKAEVGAQIGQVAEPIFENVEPEDLKVFVDEPYCILPKAKDEWWVIVPKFVPFVAGWLNHVTKSYNVFIINKYSSWLGDVPEMILKKLKFRDPIDATIINGLVVTDPTQRGEVWDRYKPHFTRREPGTDDKIRIKTGKEFELLAAMIADGILPFSKNPVEEEDLRGAKGGSKGAIELRDYQRKAWNKFLECGAVGVYWAPSAGKTYAGVYFCDRIKGPKLVLVPNNTLKEQWHKYLAHHCQHGDWETEVATYQMITRSQSNQVKNYFKKEWALIIYDECHVLPANCFSKAATIRTKYRLGLSASPHREDGRENYIFALTGFPVGLDWQDLLSIGVITLPDITVHVTSAKYRTLDKMLAVPMKTLVFVELIKDGKWLSKRFGAPFVFGDTKDRLEVIKKHQVVIISRVGDEGISIKDIERVIEYSFHGGSRRQELQRMGRVMHGIVKGKEHHVLMTSFEYEAFGHRLNSFYEKGIKVRVVRE